MRRAATWEEDTEVSTTIDLRCTPQRIGSTSSCTRSYAAARKDYCALESGQPEQAAGCRKAGSARFATEGCTFSANTRGKAGKSADWHWGTLTTEQPATDPADSPVCIGLADFWVLGKVFRKKKGKENSFDLSTKL
jgi:hypothetical protein